MQFLAPLLVAAAIVLGGCHDSEVSRELGARCDFAAECDERCLAPSPDWPGGFCTVSCDTDADCPTDAACIDEDGGVCAFRCASDPQCAYLGAGYLCRERALHATGAGMVNVCRG